MTSKVAVIILTLNEQGDLPGCLESLTWCGDIHVVDSGSTDKSQEIVKSYGATLYIHSFLSFGAQRNWALDHCRTEREWILFLDADERTTPEFVSTMDCAIRDAPQQTAGFYCCWKMMLGDRWLKRSDDFPKWQFRVLRRGRARFMDVGHGQKEGDVEGRIGYIGEPYLHYAFSKGWDYWFARHRHYARQDAQALFSQSPTFKGLFARHSSRRNSVMKALFRRIPLWPYIRFFYSFWFRGGWMEGREGFVYCRNVLWYEQQVIAELRRLVQEALKQV